MLEAEADREYNHTLELKMKFLNRAETGTSEQKIKKYNTVIEVVLII